MECDLCQIRSSQGYCAECKRLLCEVCSVACSECGKNVCATHVHETRSGKQLCAGCTRARKEKKRKKERPEPVERTSFEALDGAAHVSSDEGVDDDRPILTASARQQAPPWKLSVYAAGAAAIVMALVLAVPQFRMIGQPFSSVLAIALCAISGVWATIGLTAEAHYETRPRNFFGIAIAVVALLLAVFALQLDTTTGGDDSLEAGMVERQGMTPEELTEWRRQRLERFTPQTREETPAP